VWEYPREYGKAGGGAYQHFDIRFGLKPGYGRLLLLSGQVTKVVEERNPFLVENAADDAGEFGPVDKNWYGSSVGRS
jgi:hypothetical protein